MRPLTTGDAYDAVSGAGNAEGGPPHAAEVPASTITITITHHFSAAPNVVWKAWTDPDVVRRWWGSDPEGTVTSAVLDVRPGGHFAISFRDPSGVQHTSSGEYLRVDPIAELDFTWSWQSEPNNPSRVAVVFAAEGLGTQLRFVHSDLRGESQHDYAQGWRRTFAKLDDVLAADQVVD